MPAPLSSGEEPSDISNADYQQSKDIRDVETQVSI